VGEDLGALGSMLMVFLFMVLVFVAAYYVTKTLGKTYSIQRSSSREMRIIDHLALGRDRFLLIVEAGEKALLIGVGPQQMETLAELDKDKLSEPAEGTERADFFGLLKQRISGGRGPGGGAQQ